MVLSLSMFGFSVIPPSLFLFFILFINNRLLLLLRFDHPLQPHPKCRFCERHVSMRQDSRFHREQICKPCREGYRCWYCLKSNHAWKGSDLFKGLCCEHCLKDGKALVGFQPDRAFVASNCGSESGDGQQQEAETTSSCRAARQLARSL